MSQASHDHQKLKTDSDATVPLAAARFGPRQTNIIDPKNWSIHNVSHIGLDFKMPVGLVAEEFLQQLAEERVAVVTAPTGSGKSTFIPSLLLNLGLNVVCTEPRIIAARSLATWVSSLRGERLGDAVGYRTGEGGSCFSSLTRLTYCTDGLQMVKELMGNPGARDVLVLDEFHERNLNQDVLLAWVKAKLLQNPRFRVVIMSATIDAERISKYLNDAPVISAEGRLFPIDKRASVGSVVDNIVALSAEGKHVLAFQPGKYEIEQCIKDLKPRMRKIHKGDNFRILRLHGDLSIQEQNACFEEATQPTVVVATDFAGASITLPYINAVVDSGLHRYILTKDGVQGLYTVPITLAQLNQRLGRAGRTSPGVSVYCGNVPIKDLLPHPKPETLRLQTKNFVLRIIVFSGVDPSKLDFLDAPPKEEFAIAKKELQAIECLDANNRATQIGKQVAILPISANLGRMLVEARGLGCLESAMIAAALIEARGIIRGDSNRWRALCGEETSSDLVAQIKVFKRIRHKNIQETHEEIEEAGISVKRLIRVLDHLKYIKDRFHLNGDYKPCKPSCEYDRLIYCFAKAFPNNIHAKNSKGWQNSATSVLRSLSANSVVARDTNFLLGLPFDYGKTAGGRIAHSLIWATRVPEHLLNSKSYRLLNTFRKQEHGTKRAGRNVSLGFAGKGGRKGKR
jgi:HrpA-like RNA helicase